MSVDLPVLRAVLGGKEWAYAVWEPQAPAVVVGRSGDEGREADLERCRVDGVPVFRRRTGGGAVILSPGVLVLSLGRITGKPLAIREYSRMCNDFLIRFLEGQGVRGLCQRGISDVCLGDRKIAGSGMYRRNCVLFFQVSLLVSPDLSLMGRYLKHPPREPDYRAGRSHGDFVTSLRDAGYAYAAAGLKKSLARFAADHIGEIY